MIYEGELVSKKVYKKLKAWEEGKKAREVEENIFSKSRFSLSFESLYHQMVMLEDSNKEN